MTAKRARVISDQIMRYVESFNFSIDAKSSESLRDRNNTQGTLVHVLTKNKIEKQYTLQDNMKKSVLDGMVGKERDSNSE